MRKLLLLLFFCFITYGITAQTNTKCPENFTADNLDEYIDVLVRYKPNLRKVRNWSRKHNRQDIVWSTLRLEYWATDMVRYINKNKKIK